MFNWIDGIALVVFFLAFVSLYVWGFFLVKADTKVMLDRAERTDIKPLPLT